MKTIIDYLQALGWGVAIGTIVLLIGGAIFYFHHWGETKKEKIERRARDAARADTRS